MASAYLGATLAPPLFGIIANYLNVKLLPLYLAVFMMLSLAMLELLNKQAEEKTA
jgi:fucose permease